MRNTVDQVTGDDRGRPYAPHLERPAGRRPGRLRREDRPHGRRRLVAGRRRAPATATTIYATILGSPSRTQRNADLEALLAYGLAQYRPVDAITGGRRYATSALPYGRDPLPLVARASLGTRRAARARRSRSGSSRRPRVSLPVRRGQLLGRVQIWDGTRLVGSRPLVAARSVDRPGIAGRAGWYARRTVHHVVAAYCHDRHGHAERGVRAHDHRPELPARPAPPRERGAPARRREGNQRRPGAEDARRAGRRHRPRRRPDRACGSSSG